MKNLFKQEVLNRKRKLSHVKKAYFDMVQKNGTLSSTIRDLKSSFVKGKGKLLLKPIKLHVKLITIG